jgi:lysophospholipase L1-like esterase
MPAAFARLVLAIVTLLACVTANAAPSMRTVWLIGDSTMARKAPGEAPETGWGMPFAAFFDAGVTVDNRAMNGRSTRTFMQENRWQPVVDALREGDYVFIEVKTKASYTTETEFRDNLVKYVTDTRAKKAVPVLVTPVARRQFDAAGKVVGTHTVYAQIVRDVAAERSVPLVDLDLRSQTLLQRLGADKSVLLFNHLAPGEHPNYPRGKEDNTHFNELGARMMAQLVLQEIRDLRLDLADRIIATGR